MDEIGHLNNRYRSNSNAICSDRVNNILQSVSVRNDFQRRMDETIKKQKSNIAKDQERPITVYKTPEFDIRPVTRKVVSVPDEKNDFDKGIITTDSWRMTKPSLIVPTNPSKTGVTVSSYEILNGCKHKEKNRLRHDKHKSYTRKIAHISNDGSYAEKTSMDKGIISTNCWKMSRTRDLLKNASRDSSKTSHLKAHRPTAVDANLPDREAIPASQESCLNSHDMFHRDNLDEALKGSKPEKKRAIKLRPKKPKITVEEEKPPDEPKVKKYDIEDVRSYIQKQRAQRKKLGRDQKRLEIEMKTSRENRLQELYSKQKQAAIRATKRQRVSLQDDMSVSLQSSSDKENHTHSRPESSETVEEKFVEEPSTHISAIPDSPNQGKRLKVAESAFREERNFKSDKLMERLQKLKQTADMLRSRIDNESKMVLNDTFLLKLAQMRPNKHSGDGVPTEPKNVIDIEPVKKPPIKKPSKQVPSKEILDNYHYPGVIHLNAKGTQDNNQTISSNKWVLPSPTFTYAKEKSPQHSPIKPQNLHLTEKSKSPPSRVFLSKQANDLRERLNAAEAGLSSYDFSNYHQYKPLEGPKEYRSTGGDPYSVINLYMRDYCAKSSIGPRGDAAQSIKVHSSGQTSPPSQVDQNKLLFYPRSSSQVQLKDAATLTSPKKLYPQVQSVQINSAEMDEESASSISEALPLSLSKKSTSASLNDSDATDISLQSSENDSLTVSNFQPPTQNRFSPHALEHKFQVEMNYYYNIEESLRQLSGVDQTNALGHSRQEVLSLANLLRTNEESAKKDAEFRKLTEKIEAERASLNLQAAQKQAQEAVSRADKLSQMASTDIDRIHLQKEIAEANLEATRNLAKIAAVRKHSPDISLTSSASLSSSFQSSSTSILPTGKPLSSSSESISRSLKEHTSSKSSSSGTKKQTRAPGDLKSASSKSYSKKASKSLKSSNSSSDSSKSEAAKIAKDAAISSAKDVTRKVALSSPTLNDLLISDSSLTDFFSDDTLSTSTLLSSPRLKNYEDTMPGISKMYLKSRRFSEEMLLKFIKEEEQRSQQQANLLRQREKVLKEKARAEMKYLEMKKASRNSDMEIAAIKKRQKAILLKLEMEQAELKRFEIANLQAKQERQLLIIQQRKVAKMKESTRKIKEKIRKIQLEDLKDDGHSSTASDVSILKKKLARNKLKRQRRDTSISLTPRGSEVLSDDGSATPKASEVLPSHSTLTRSESQETLQDYSQVFDDESREFSKPTHTSTPSVKEDFSVNSTIENEEINETVGTTTTKTNINYSEDFIEEVSKSTSNKQPVTKESIESVIESASGSTLSISEKKDSFDIEIESLEDYVPDDSPLKSSTQRSLKDDEQIYSSIMNESEVKSSTQKSLIEEADQIYSSLSDDSEVKTSSQKSKKDAEQIPSSISESSEIKTNSTHKSTKSDGKINSSISIKSEENISLEKTIGNDEINSSVVSVDSEMKPFEQASIKEIEEMPSRKSSTANESEYKTVTTKSAKDDEQSYSSVVSEKLDLSSSSLSIADSSKISENKSISTSQNSLNNSTSGKDSILNDTKQSSIRCESPVQKSISEKTDEPSKHSQIVSTINTHKSSNISEQLEEDLNLDSHSTTENSLSIVLTHSIVENENIPKTEDKEASHSLGVAEQSHKSESVTSSKTSSITQNELKSALSSEISGKIGVSEPIDTEDSIHEVVSILDSPSHSVSEEEKVERLESDVIEKVGTITEHVLEDLLNDTFSELSAIKKAQVMFAHSESQFVDIFDSLDSKKHSPEALDTSNDFDDAFIDDDFQPIKSSSLPKSIIGNVNSIPPLDITDITADTTAKSSDRSISSGLSTAQLESYAESRRIQTHNFRRRDQAESKSYIPPKEEIRDLVGTLASHFFNLNTQGVPLVDGSQPPKFSEYVSTYCSNLSSVDNRSVRSYFTMLFELVKSICVDIYAKREKPVHAWMKPRESQKLHSLKCDASSLESVTAAVQERTFLLMNIHTKRDNHSQVLKFGYKRRDLVDKILVQELREEENLWTNYNDDELSVKMQLTDAIFDTLIDDTVHFLKSFPH